MADFTKISAQDEHKALDLIQKQNEIIKPIVEKHNGEWLKEIGEGLVTVKGIILNMEIMGNVSV